MTVQRLRLQLPGGGGYDIRIGSGVLGDLSADLVARGSSRRVMLLTDEHLEELYLPSVQNSLADAGFDCLSLVVPAGEASKGLEVVTELWQSLAAAKISGSDLLLILGGGVLTDLGGFVASAWQRGLRYACLPTTLMAMADAAIGGKTALNLPGGRNLIGTVWQPCFVGADLETLASLPEEHWSSGLAAVARAALVTGAEDWEWLIGHAKALCCRQPDAVQKAVFNAASSKARAVAADERQESPAYGALLAYGQEFGHALELESGFQIPHGQAIAEGMRFMAQLAVEAIGAAPTFADAQVVLLDSLGLPAFAGQFSADALYDRILRSNKRFGGGLRLVLATAPGQLHLVEVDPDLIKVYLTYWEESWK
ncbi:MAG: 3-dehydroquinate synthase [Actinomycetia bacterium]|nr:3-dehydroquinate synthase [Actinomycetes bacterium]